MSPEQATASDVDGRSDLFSLGCTMYHLLTGQVPYPGETVVECLTRRARRGPVPITDFRPDLPPQVVAVIDKLMAQRPEHRFQSAVEAAKALQGLAGHHHADSCSEGLSPPLPHPGNEKPALLPHETPALSAGSEAPVNPSLGTPDLSRSFRRRLTALLAAIPPWRSPLVFVIVALVIFFVGFALGLACTLMLRREGASDRKLPQVQGTRYSPPASPS
jgi:serine/threonine-protein kinase